jgi:2-polyprenyl-3-methyl-5-hydroxy-6-metoxy-1,4-benzoquinol methylase
MSAPRAMGGTRPQMNLSTQSAVGQTCLLCGGVQHRPVFTEFGIDILRCDQCRHVFSSYASEPHYENFWGDQVDDSDHLYWKKARARMYEDFFRRFIAGRTGRLLDMGSGLGFFLKLMTSCPGWESYGCEISPAAVRYAREKLGLTNVECTKLEASKWPPGSFDIVTIWDVLDHVLYPDPFLRRCHWLLREGGFCLIRVPNIAMHLPRARMKKLLWGMRSDMMYLQARDHPHHYSASAVRTILERNGFEVQFLHLRPTDSMNPLARGLRDVWFQAVRALAILSRGRLNYDNLFVIARKGILREPQNR